MEIMEGGFFLLLVSCLPFTGREFRSSGVVGGV